MIIDSQTFQTIKKRAHARHDEGKQVNGRKASNFLFHCAAERFTRLKRFYADQGYPGAIPQLLAEAFTDAELAIVPCHLALAAGPGTGVHHQQRKAMFQLAMTRLMLRRLAYGPGSPSRHVAAAADA